MNQPGTRRRLGLAAGRDAVGRRGEAPARRDGGGRPPAIARRTEHSAARESLDVPELLRVALDVEGGDAAVVDGEADDGGDAVGAGAAQAAAAVDVDDLERPEVAARAAKALTARATRSPRPRAACARVDHAAAVGGEHDVRGAEPPSRPSQVALTAAGRRRRRSRAAARASPGSAGGAPRRPCAPGRRAGARTRCVMPSAAATSSKE